MPELGAEPLPPLDRTHLLTPRMDLDPGALDHHGAPDQADPAPVAIPTAGGLAGLTFD